MNKGVSVQAFNGDGSRHGVEYRFVEICAGEEEDRTKSFSPGLQAILHGLMDLGRLFPNRREKIDQGFIDGLDEGFWERVLHGF